MTGEELLYKWEAMSFGVSPRVFNADTIPALKQHIQRELAKQNAKKLHAKSNTSGLMSRNLHARAGPSISLQNASRSKPNISAAATSASGTNAFAAGPSKVKLVVPGQDDQAKRERHCEYCARPLYVH